MGWVKKLFLFKNSNPYFLSVVHTHFKYEFCELIKQSSAGRLLSAVPKANSPTLGAVSTGIYIHIFKQEGFCGAYICFFIFLEIIKSLPTVKSEIWFSYLLLKPHPDSLPPPNTPTHTHVTFSSPGQYFWF